MLGTTLRVELCVLLVCWRRVYTAGLSNFTIVKIKYKVQYNEEVYELFYQCNSWLACWTVLCRNHLCDTSVQFRRTKTSLFTRFKKNSRQFGFYFRAYWFPWGLPFLIIFLGNYLATLQIHTPLIYPPAITIPTALHVEVCIGESFRWWRFTNWARWTSPVSITRRWQTTMNSSAFRPMREKKKKTYGMFCDTVQGPLPPHTEKEVVRKVLKKKWTIKQPT